MCGLCVYVCGEVMCVCVWGGKCVCVWGGEGKWVCVCLFMGVGVYVCMVGRG